MQNNKLEEIEITNGTLEKIFSLYMLSNILINDSFVGADYDEQEYCNRHLNVYNVGDIHLLNSYTLFDIGVGFKKCQLMLMPLSEITDEDCIEIAKIAGVSSYVNIQMAGRELIEHYLKSSSCNVRGLEWWKIQDHLRANHYMLPACGIDDLFEAGIAINKNKLNKNG